MEKKPLKRHQALQPLSRQHHYGLLFSWKLRKGFSKNIEVERLQKFAKWFYRTEIEPHFAAEEKYIFPILDESNPMLQRAIADHREIEALFNDTNDVRGSLALLENRLETHIRFEERELFAAIQSVATDKQLSNIEAIHLETPAPVYDDPFWENEVK